MQDIQQFIIPKTIDDPAMIGYWTAGQVTIIGFSLYLGVLIGTLKGLVIMLAFGLGICYIYSYFGSKGKGVVMSIFYWSFSSWLTGFKYFPKSYKRSYVG